jgi:hypothetical protein
MMLHPSRAGKVTIVTAPSRVAAGQIVVSDVQDWPRSKRNQDSLFSFVSSMVMSLNSLESNMSPHSRHSTNSESSSRDTIWTRGCLHSFIVLLLSEVCGGEIGVINPTAYARHARGRGITREIGGILALPLGLSSPLGINTRLPLMHSSSVRIRVHHLLWFPEANRNGASGLRLTYSESICYDLTRLEMAAQSVEGRATAPVEYRGNADAESAAHRLRPGLPGLPKYKRGGAWT